MAKSIRNAAYFELRLKKDHPAIYADLMGGKYPSIRSAAIAAGLVKPNTRLKALKNGWLKADSDEREEFLDWLVAQGHLAASRSPGVGITGTVPVAAPGPAVRSPSAHGAQSALDADKRLQPWARERIEKIITGRSLTASKAMNEIQPLSSIYDGSLGNAIHQAERLLGVDSALLEAWIEDNSIKLGL